MLTNADYFGSVRWRERVLLERLQHNAIRWAATTLAGGDSRMRAMLVLLAVCAYADIVPGQATPRRARITATLRLDANKEDFSVVGPVKVDPSGQIAITFRQDAQIRVYDSAGIRLTTFGRKGQGPGEFGEMQVPGIAAQMRIGPARKLARPTGERARFAFDNLQVSAAARG